MPVIYMRHPQGTKYQIEYCGKCNYKSDEKGVIKVFESAWQKLDCQRLFTLGYIKCDDNWLKINGYLEEKKETVEEAIERMKTAEVTYKTANAEYKEAAPILDFKSVESGSFKQAHPSPEIVHINLDPTKCSHIKANGKQCGWRKLIGDMCYIHSSGRARKKYLADKKGKK